MSSITTDNNDQHPGGSGEITLSKKECTSCEQNTDTITEGLNSVAILNDMTCAACGKEGNSKDMNTCNKCKMVKYCNAACKKKHRSKHKKACEKRVAELHDEALFKEVEPKECPICLIPLPLDDSQIQFQTCCGKLICDGCIYGMKMSKGKDLCAFCRTPNAKSEDEHIKRTSKLIDKGIGRAFHFMAGLYAQGLYGMQQDYRKANELWLKAGELGCTDGYFNLAKSYSLGSRGVEPDKKKVIHYYELAAMGGQVVSRHNLGCLEGKAGNNQQALKHFMIAARAGHKTALEAVKKGYEYGLVTKDEYASTLRAYHERRKDMKSDERDQAAASVIFSR